MTAPWKCPTTSRTSTLPAGFQGNLEGMYPGLTRPILFDYRKYNQDLTTGSLLLEVGSHGNTLEQAQYSGELIGKALAQTLLKLQR
ncbi:MAG: stage II sporulation protein P [Ruminococcus sp.]